MKIYILCAYNAQTSRDEIEGIYSDLKVAMEAYDKIASNAPDGTVALREHKDARGMFNPDGKCIISNIDWSNAIL